MGVCDNEAFEVAKTVSYLSLLLDNWISNLPNTVCEVLRVIYIFIC